MVLIYLKTFTSAQSIGYFVCKSSDTLLFLLVHELLALTGVSAARPAEIAQLVALGKVRDAYLKRHDYLLRRVVAGDEQGDSSATVKRRGFLASVQFYRCIDEPVEEGFHRSGCTPSVDGC